MQNTIVCFLSFLLVANIVLFFRLYASRKTNIRRYISYTEFGMTALTLSEIVILLAKNRQIAYCAFSFYYIAFAWYLLTVFRFSVCYAGYRPGKPYKSPLFWLLTAESAVFIWGIFSEQFFTIAHAKWYEHIYWISRNFSLLYLYSAINGVMIAATVIILIIAAARSARIYRLKYSGIVIIILVMMACSTFSQLHQQPAMVRVILIAICEMTAVYVAVRYAPKKLNQRAMQFIADKLNDGIVLYDEEHHLQLITAGYSAAFGAKAMEGIEDEQTYWAKAIAEAKTENAWNGRVKSITREDGTYYYEIHHMALSEDEKLIGTVYWIRNVTDAIENYRNMVRRANFDELTGIYNEAHFHEVSRQMLDDNPEKSYVMVCLSVEKFRIFRGLFGREKSNEYLIRTAGMLKTAFENTTVCKYGKSSESDFYLLMPKELFQPQELFDRLDSVITAYDANNFHLEVKVGVYEIVDTSLPLPAICSKALMASDTIKGNYGKRILWFDESIQRDSMRRERYNAELTKAIEHGEIQFYLQPQIDRNGNLVGSEALARWIHREEGFLSPAQFIPYFEQNGRITELDISIWRQACKKLKEWKEMGRDDLCISVNISAKDVYALDIYEHFSSLIREFGISASNLKLEITESAIISDQEQHINLVDRLQAAGFEVEMDDFGSAYSSFNMLKDICVDVLKIDMKFLENTENTDRSHVILKSIVDLAKALNMRTIAEGVETETQLTFLKNVGCDVYQGYYYAKPMSIADFEAKYVRN